MIFENKEEIDKFHNNDENIYRYKVNAYIVVLFLRTDLVQMFFTDVEKKKEFVKEDLPWDPMTAVPERHDRSFMSKKKMFSSKFFKNHGVKLMRLTWRDFLRSQLQPVLWSRPNRKGNEVCSWRKISKILRMQGAQNAEVPLNGKRKCRERST